MKVKLVKVRLAFPAIWNAESVKQPDGTMSAPKFGATALFAPDHPCVAEIKDKIRQVAKAKWADKADAMLAALKEEGKICLRNGNGKPEYDGYPGNLYIKGSNKVRPLILDRDGETPLAEADGVIYGGCYVNMMLDIWAQQNGWGKRINATLTGLQFHSKGDAFGAGAPATKDDFEDLGQEEGALETAGGFDDDDFT